MNNRVISGCAYLALGLAACASAEPGGRTILPVVTGVQAYAVPWEHAFPSDIALGPDGRVWFTDRMTHVVGVFDPQAERFTSHATPTPLSAPYGMVSGADGAVWFAESQAGRLGRIDTRTGAITEYDLGVEGGGPHLLAWHGDELWFTMREAGAYGRFDPRRGEAQVYRVEGERPYGIAVVRGRIWISSFDSSRLLEVDPETGAATRHDLRTLLDTTASRGSGSGAAAGRRRALTRIAVRRMTAGTRDDLWFTNLARGMAGRYEPGAARLTLFETFMRQARPYGIAVDSRGRVWYSEKEPGELIALDPYADRRRRIELPGGQGYVRHIVVDERRGRVWLPVSDAGALVVVEFRREQVVQAPGRVTCTQPGGRACGR